MSITGGCSCGKVRYESQENEASGAICHCNNCRKSSGTGHVANAFLPDDTFSVSGDLKTSCYTADSGSTVTRSFCPECGSSIVSRSPNFPGVVVVRVSSFDDPNKFNPGMVVYAKQQASWDTQQPDIPHFDEMPPPQD